MTMRQRFVLSRLGGAADPYASPYRKKDAGDMPDPNPGMFRIADVSEKLGMQYLDMEKQQQAIQNDRAAQADELAKKVVDQQLSIADQNQQLANEDIAYNRETFRPIEKQLADEASRFGTTAEQNRLAQQAETDVVNAYDQRRASTMEKLRQFGVNPASGNYAAMMQDMDLQQAADQAGAANRARVQGRDMAFAKKMDAASIGRGLPAQASTSYGIALNGGSAAMGNQMAANQSYNAGIATSQRYGQMGIGALGNAANTYQGIYNSQLQGYGMQSQAASQQSAGTWGAVGSAVGMAAVML